MLQIKTLVSLGLAVWLTGLGFSTSAQEWPSKSVRLIVPMPPAGTTDNMGRLVAQKMSDIIGQVVVVENKAGANGFIALQYVLSQPADGYTLLYGVTGANFIAPAIYRKLPYDPVKDLAPISLLFFFLVIAVLADDAGLDPGPGPAEGAGRLPFVGVDRGRQPDPAGLRR